MYGSLVLTVQKWRSPKWELVRLSKILLYERPCDVTGISEPTGLKEAPKDICIARIIGTWKARNMEGTQAQ